MEFQPRFIRSTKAHTYLGMCQTVFNREVRPYLTLIKVGGHANARGRAFDRLDLDQFAEEYKRRMGCAPLLKKPEEPTWHNQHQDSSCVVKPITSTSNTSAKEFEAVAKRVIGTKR